MGIVREKNGIYVIVTLLLMILAWGLTGFSPFIIVDIILEILSGFFPFFDMAINTQNGNEGQSVAWMIALILAELINSFVNYYLDEETTGQKVFMWSGNLFIALTISMLQSNFNLTQLENIIYFLFELMCLVLVALAIYATCVVITKGTGGVLYMMFGVLYMMFYPMKLFVWNPIGKGIIFAFIKIFFYLSLSCILLIPGVFIPLLFVQYIWCFVVVFSGYFIMEIASALVDKIDQNKENERVIRFCFAVFIIVIEVFVYTGHTLPVLS